MDSKIRLAVADDHEIVRKGLIEIILSFGEFTVDIEAGNGKELYDNLLAAEQLPDIIVMDISMPVWDGYETLDAIRGSWPDMKVLVLTMHKHEFAIIRMFRSGVNGYLLKNTKPKDLRNALLAIMDTGLYFSEIASSNLYHRLQHSNIIPLLSQKEIQLLKYCPTDLSYEEIASKMNVTERSIAGYRTRLFEKTGVNSRVGLVICAIKMGIVSVD